MRSISAFFPVLNEEGTIERLTNDLIRFLGSHFEQFEIIIVNDGSSDNTGMIAQTLASRFSESIKVIDFATTRGYGNALKAGFEASRYELVFYTDGDYQFDLNDLNAALILIKECDIVVGYRKKRHDDSFRLWQSKGYNNLIKKNLRLEPSRC